jgi:hypothetical protein
VKIPSGLAALEIIVHAILLTRIIAWTGVMM